MGTRREKLHADLSEMQGLVEAGLAYARSAQPATEAVVSLDLHALLDGLVCDYRDAGHIVHLYSEPAAPLRTRPQALRRVLGNLVDNALKFGGEAWVRVQDDPTYTLICVEDHGSGIPEAQLGEVARPFYRLEGSRSRDTGGAGLGLAIAHQLAEQALGGHLTLGNRAKGGLIATLHLPLHLPLHLSPQLPLQLSRSSAP